MRGGISMNFPNGPHKPNNEEECNCCIKVDNSLVLIICGELDQNHFKDTLKSYFEVQEAANAHE